MCFLSLSLFVSRREKQDDDLAGSKLRFESSNLSRSRTEVPGMDYQNLKRGKTLKKKQERPESQHLAS